MNADQELLEIFRAEVREQLDVLGTELAQPSKAWNVAKLFRLAHNIKGAARMVGARVLQDAAHRLEDLFSALRENRPRDEPIVALAREGVEWLERCLDPAAEHDPPDLEPFARRLAELLDEPYSPSEIAGPSGTRSPAQMADDLDAGPEGASKEDEEAELPTPESTTLRIAAGKVDRLMELAEELARLTDELDDHHRMTHALCQSLEDGVVNKETADLVRRLRFALRTGRRPAQLVDELRQAILGLRLVAVDGLRSHLGRVLRAACNTSGKQALLHIHGGETEIDRALLDALRDPLVHLLRNAMAHGIESPAERRAAGKGETGNVHLSARSAGAWVEIEVSDDGRGVDFGALRQHLLTLGALEHEDEASDRDCLELLFEPGFSTASASDQLAGRGVGLDVVRWNLRRLGGEIEVDSSAEGALFRLRVPLTRLTTRGIVVRLDALQFILPVEHVERCLLVDRSDMANADGQRVLDLAGPGSGDVVPITELERLLGMGVPDWDRRPAVVVRHRQRRRALLVDEVQGEREALLQPLSWNLEYIPGVSGCTVLGGRVVPLLDPRAMVELDPGDETRRAAGAASLKDRKQRLLVADDSVTSRTLLKNILGSVGFEVDVATHGAEAWERLRQRRFDLLLSDVDMPHLDGLELTRKVRADPELDKLPVVLLTSLGDQEHRRQGAEAGADAYLVKGVFDQDALLKAVRRLL